MSMSRSHDSAVWQKTTAPLPLAMTILFATLADAGFRLQFHAFTTSRLNRSWAFGLPLQYGSTRTTLPAYSILKLVAPKTPPSWHADRLTSA